MILCSIKIYLLFFVKIGFFFRFSENSSRQTHHLVCKQMQPAITVRQQASKLRREQDGTLQVYPDKETSASYIFRFFYQESFS